MLIGTAIMRLLPNFASMWEIPSTLEPTVIGSALLACAILDEQLRRGITWRDVLQHLLRHRWKYVAALVGLAILRVGVALALLWREGNLIE